MNLLNRLRVGWRGRSWENTASNKSFHHRCNGRSMELSWNGPSQAYSVLDVLVSCITGSRCGTLWHALGPQTWPGPLGIDLAAELAQNLCCQHACLEREKVGCFLDACGRWDEIMPGLSVHLLTKHIMAIYANMNAKVLHPTRSNKQCFQWHLSARANQKKNQCGFGWIEHLHEFVQFCTIYTNL